VAALRSLGEQHLLKCCQQLVPGDMNSMLLGTSNKKMLPHHPISNPAKWQFQLKVTGRCRQRLLPLALEGVGRRT